MPPRNEIAAPASAEHSTLYVVVEISRKSWAIGIKSPVNERTPHCLPSSRRSERVR